MKLKHLTLNKIVDAAYCCGIAGTPSSILIAAPPGTGKTWSTRGISDCHDVPFVQYITGAMSPTTHRESIMQQSESTRLIVHDDIGLCSRFDQDQIFATYMMAISGEISFRQYKRDDHAYIKASVVICCTLGYYSDHSKNLQQIGLLDRVLPVVVGLSKETRAKYQNSINIFDDEPPKRTPEVIDQRTPQMEILIENDISPRWMRNISKISQFLSEDELIELISVINRPLKYEV